MHNPNRLRRNRIGIETDHVGNAEIVPRLADGEVQVANLGMFLRLSVVLPVVDTVGDFAREHDELVYARLDGRMLLPRLRKAERVEKAPRAVVKLEYRPLLSGRSVGARLAVSFSFCSSSNRRSAKAASSALERALKRRLRLRSSSR